MIKILASEIKNHFGEYLERALTEPVVIEKFGHSSVVMLSMKEYERLIALEDAHWAKRAINAEKTGYVTQKKIS